MELKVRAIAFYLPQFHPIPENDAWWGKGFTEWTNVAKAKPLFRGHSQPFLPSDLGFYDLRVPEIREQQATLAKTHGIEGFCYWHYWFGNGKQLLERPFQEVLKSGKPDFPFCLGWANETWTGIWHGSPKKILIEQVYPGVEDYTDHFYSVLDAFKDKRYIKVEGKPIFPIYRPNLLPDCNKFTSLWQSLAKKENLPGIHFIAISDNENFQSCGFDGSLHRSFFPVLNKIPKKLIEKIPKLNLNKIKYLNTSLPSIYRYSDYVKFDSTDKLSIGEYPLIIPGWDNTPRSGKNGLVFTGTSPKLFKQSVINAVSRIEHKPKEHRLLFIKSWNEWAEGNCMEPSVKFGNDFLKTFKEVVQLND